MIFLHTWLDNNDDNDNRIAPRKVQVVKWSPWEQNLSCTVLLLSSFHFQRLHDFFYFHKIPGWVRQHIIHLNPLPCQLGLELGIMFLEFFSRNEINRVWLSEPWLSFHYFWIEEKHLNRGKGRIWHRLGTWHDGIAIRRYLQSVHSKSHWGPLQIIWEINPWTYVPHWYSAGVSLKQILRYQNNWYLQL